MRGRHAILRMSMPTLHNDMGCLARAPLTGGTRATAWHCRNVPDTVFGSLRVTPVGPLCFLHVLDSS